jgi:hypothetical protein
MSSVAVMFEVDFLFLLLQKEVLIENEEGKINCVYLFLPYAYRIMDKKF